MKKIKFSTVTVPTSSSELQALGILFQALTENLSLLVRKKKSTRGIRYFIRERLDGRERRVLFSILNQLRDQVGIRLDTLKRQGKSGKTGRVLETVDNTVPVMNLAQEVLHLLCESVDKENSIDDFADRHDSSSVDLEAYLDQISKLIDRQDKLQRHSRSSEGGRE